MKEIVNAIRHNEFYKIRKYKYYSILIRDYKAYGKSMSILKIADIHKKGFTVGDWILLRMTEENYKYFLNSRDYYSIHPINGWYSDWIDNKLTLKYILNGTSLSDNMPEYYYLIDETGAVKPLIDCQIEKEQFDTEDIAELLQKKGVLALKLSKGSLGRGFYKLEYSPDTRGGYLVNDVEYNLEEFKCFLNGLKDYLVTEYLRPHTDLAKFSPNTANSLRYVACRVDGKLRLFKSFIRLGTKKSGQVENFNSGGVLCYIDESGHFSNGYVITNFETKSVELISKMVDSDLELTGNIPLWDEINNCVAKNRSYFSHDEISRLRFCCDL